MNITGIPISPTAIISAVAAGSVAEAEAKLRNVEDALRTASKEWEAFGAGPAVKAVNSGRALSAKETTDLIIGVYKLVRGTAAVLSAEHAALAALLQAVKTVNRKG